MKVVVAMSGGVDSSVAALILQEQGYEVIGVSMQLWDYGEAEENGKVDTGGSCCSLDDLTDARRVADKLGIPFYILNMEKAFSREVVDYFVESYLSGETPNPCTKCNQILKFDLLLRKARELGVNLLATGHYARVVKKPEEGSGGAYRLFKGVDPAKDQSYFLFTMNQDELGSVIFPLGAMTKEEVRAYAREHDVRTAEKEESQEICFIPDDDYGGFIAERTPAVNGANSGGDLGKPGDIVDKDGKKLGSHRGLFRYTIGQRKGLNIGGAGGPYYVTGIEISANLLVVGPREELYSSGLVAREVNWVTTAPSPDETVTAKTRYRHEGSKCVVIEAPDKCVEVRFTKPEKAVTPGQAVVFYRGDEVLGGGWIREAVK